MNKVNVTMTFELDLEDIIDIDEYDREAAEKFTQEQWRDLAWEYSGRFWAAILEASIIAENFELQPKDNDPVVNVRVQGER